MSLRAFYEDYLKDNSEVLSEDPVHHLTLATAYLKLGYFKEGWREFEWRWKTKDFWKDEEVINHDFVQPFWNGEKVGALLVYAEQGMGDTLHFCRYLSLALERADQVIFSCQPALVQLMESYLKYDVKVVQGYDHPCDARIPLMSLPNIFPETIPPAPYILLPERDRKGIGYWCNSRYLPKDRIARDRYTEHAIRRCPERHYFQKLPGKELKGESFLTLAEEIAELALLITVDTATIHLAGAMGAKTWLLLPYLSCWRWQLDRNDSPWYPTIRIFRQQEPGKWDNVFDEIHKALEELGNGKYDDS